MRTRRTSSIVDTDQTSIIIIPIPYHYHLLASSTVNSSDRNKTDDGTMADLLSQTQDPMPVLQDDLLKDRIRQFTEFLDDEASPPSVAS